MGHGWGGLARAGLRRPDRLGIAVADREAYGECGETAFLALVGVEEFAAEVLRIRLGHG